MVHQAMTCLHRERRDDLLFKHLPTAVASYSATRHEWMRVSVFLAVISGAQGRTFICLSLSSEQRGSCVYLRGMSTRRRYQSDAGMGTGFRVQGLGFRVQGLGLKVQGSGFGF